MKLPNREAADVSEEKLTEYLLSFAHPAGRGKAEFFSRFGFKASNWHALADALMRHAQVHRVAKAEATAFGMRYTIEGVLETPDGRQPIIRAIWFVEHGESTPRFVTAYPC